MNGINHPRQRAIDYAELLLSRGWRLLEADVRALIEEARGQLEIVDPQDAPAVARVQERIQTYRALLELPARKSEEEKWD
ncbi:MAG: hypothetical protein ACYC7E_18930 [Armatimonadota bacterium]